MTLWTPGDLATVVNHNYQIRVGHFGNNRTTGIILYSPNDGQATVNLLLFNYSCYFI